MQNDQGQPVDLYIPRKCSWTNRIISAKDHSSVQINVGHVDPKTGRYDGTCTTFALSGFVRDKGEGDQALGHMVSQMENKWPVEA